MNIQLLFLASTTFFSDISLQALGTTRDETEYVFYIGSSQEIELSSLQTPFGDENSAFSIAGV